MTLVSTIAPHICRSPASTSDLRLLISEHDYDYEHEHEFFILASSFDSSDL